MGVDRHAARFCTWLRGKGVSYNRVLTLGRQGLHLSRAELQAILNHCEATADAEQVIAQEQGYSEPFFRVLGADEVTSLDVSDMDGATWRHDLNQPVPTEWKDRFSVVFDGGTLEHIFNFPCGLKNAMDMVAPGGHFIAVTPTHNFMGHGFYQFSPDLFFRVFSESNGFLLLSVVIFEMTGRHWFRVKDPQEVGGRIRIHASTPTCLGVCAKKIRPSDLTPICPQQSDYAAKWSAHVEKSQIGKPTCPYTNRYNRPWHKRWLHALEKWFKPSFPRRYFLPFNE